MEFQLILFLISIGLQAIGALFTDFTNDWDESGNYWEPLHFLLYGKGLQTWEWNKDNALRSPFIIYILAFIGRGFQNLGLSRYMVFYFTRVSVGIIGSFSVYCMCLAIKRKFGEMVAVFTFILTIFNNFVLFYMNRLNMDSMMAILNMFVFALWLENQVFLVIFFSLLTSMLRINYLPVFGIIALQLLFSWEERKTSFKDWVIQLFLYGLSISLFWTGVFLAIDSYWYKRPTLSFLNFLYYNIIKNQSVMYGVHSTFKYLDCFLRDNNSLVFVGSIFGLWVTSRSRIYALPYICTFVYHQIMLQKHERFMYFIYPIMCLYCAICMFWFLQLSFIIPPTEYMKPELTELGEDIDGMPILIPQETSLKRRQTRKLPQKLVPEISKEKIIVPTGKLPEISTPKFTIRTIIVFVILGFYILSGISTMLLRVYQHGTHYYFYKSEVETLLSIDNVRDFSCLSATPWSSWWLPLECKKIYTVQILDEFFPGYNKASFRRFENSREWALIPIQNTTSLYFESQMNWNDTLEVKKFMEISKKVNYYDTVFEKDKIQYIFIQGGNAINNKTAQLFKDMTGKSLRHGKQTSIVFFYELVLGKYLHDNFELVVESFPLGNVFDIPTLSRQLGWWLLEPGMDSYENARVGSLTLWRRIKK